MTTEPVTSRLDDAVSELDAAIREIRGAVFTGGSERAAKEGAPRGRGHAGA